MSGTKHDIEKDRWSLVPMKELVQVAKVFTEGAKKYGDNNWQLVENGRQRYLDALMRHVAAYAKGEKINEEDFGLEHMAHVAWNALALMWFDNNSNNNNADKIPIEYLFEVPEGKKPYFVNGKWELYDECSCIHKCSTCAKNETEYMCIDLEDCDEYNSEWRCAKHG